VYSWLGFGYAFLYVPIALLVANSFNASRIGSHWGGFSLQWYARLLEDPQILDAAWLSLRVAFLSACAATLIGG
jgi:putrescine transport system permease protein